MYLQEAVQICAGTTRKFRRPVWVKGFAVMVLLSPQEFEDNHDGVTYSDMRMDEPGGGEWAFIPLAADVLASDYEVTP